MTTLSCCSSAPAPYTAWVALWEREMAVALTLARQVLAGWRTPLSHEAIL